LTVVF